jgi:ABC-2 type transport system permease protein
MNLRRAWAVARKESLHVSRDPLSLALAIVLPVVMLLLYGYALRLDVENVPLAVWDRSGTPQSRELLSRFSGSRYFRLVPVRDGYREIERGILREEVLAALVVPSGFASDLASGREAPVQLILDGSDSNTATVVQGYVEGVAAGFGRDLAERAAAAAGRPPPVDPVALSPRIWFNEEMTSRNHVIPGLVAVIMMVISAMLTSLTVAREWEQGTMEPLVATPVTSAELVVGKLVPYFGLGMLDMLLSVAAGELLFDVPLRGSVPFLFGMSAVFLVGALSLGMLISVATKAQLPATQLAMVTTFVPGFLLSGFVFPIWNMPRPIQVATRLIPARYFVSILRGIYLKGAGPAALAGEAALLALFGAAVLALSIRKLRKKLE